MELNTMNKLSLNLTQTQICQLTDYAHWVVKVWDEPKEGLTTVGVKSIQTWTK